MGMNLTDSTAFTLSGPATDIFPAIGWLKENVADYSVSLNTGGMVGPNDKITAVVVIPDSTQALYFKMAWADI